jgi:hypothetical protein
MGYQGTGYGVDFVIQFNAREVWNVEDVILSCHSERSDESLLLRVSSFGRKSITISMK